ncbi:MAG: HIT family protein [Bacteroidales bacterium]|jgi:histidine triad (HIT) family protein|nr:HIT family protein [Bacteroidales bacterium]
MASIFSKIIAGEIPSFKVAEDENNFAFLDINPIARGHVLAVPKREVDYLFDVDDRGLSSLILFSRRVAKAIERVVPCKRVGIAVIGLEVPHAHIHLIPLHGVYDIDFSRPKLKLSPEEFKETAQKIAAQFSLTAL